MLALSRLPTILSRLIAGTMLLNLRFNDGMIIMIMMLRENAEIITFWDSAMTHDQKTVPLQQHNWPPKLESLSSALLLRNL